MPDFPTRVTEWLLDLVAFVGVGLGGASAAAAGELDRLRQVSMHEHGDVPLSPERLAEATLKSAVGVEWAKDEARKSGVTGDNFDVLTHSIGNPPGAGELLDMMRRGIIDRPGFDLGLRQGYTRNDWIDRIAELRRALLPVGELVQAAVQNHLPFGEAMARATNHGIDGDDFQVLYDTAGNPPGPMEVLNLWNRGEIDEATVDQALRESRLKDKYIAALKRLAIRKIPLRTITTLLTHGAINDATAVQHLRELGYTTEDADALVKAAHFQKAPHAKELSVSQIRSLYGEHAITRDQAVTDLQAIGYSGEIANQIMALADIDVRNATRKATITKIRTGYDSRRIDRTQATTDLDKVGVPADQRDALLSMWDIEREIAHRTLTEGQVVAAGRLRLFTEEAVLGRLTAMGYSDDDAFVLAVIGKVIANPAAPTA